jgi:hypothetical protein
MKLKRNMYVPALRWRQGEYQALFKLSNEAKDRVVPLITIPKIEYDFEQECDRHSIDEHIQPFAARFKKKWGKRPAWVGIHKSIINQPLADGSHILTRIFKELSEGDGAAVPIIAVDTDDRTIAAAARLTQARGIGISLRVEDLMRSTAGSLLQSLASRLNASPSDIDLIIDLGAPNFEPYRNFADALISALRSLGDLSKFRNFVLVGTAIPNTFKDLAKGGDEIPRHDWLFYQTLSARLPKYVRRPNFGDYTIVHPEFSPLDMRKIKSGGKLVYTTRESWLVHKGGAFRDNREQMHDHCAAVVGARNFSGADFSNGDSYIAKCAVREVGPSSQTRWKEVAINHHITRVLNDLATLSVAS